MIYAEGNKYIVNFYMQNEVEDIFRITDKETGEETFERYPRSMGQTAENILSYLE